jgi:hypothetical protein
LIPSAFAMPTAMPYAMPATMTYAMPSTYAIQQPVATSTFAVPQYAPAVQYAPAAAVL